MQDKCGETNFKTFMAVMFQLEVFWVMTLCSVVVRYQCFRGPCCLHLHFMLPAPSGWSKVQTNVSEDGGTGILAQHYTPSQPRWTRLFTVVKTSNLADTGLDYKITLGEVKQERLWLGIV